MGAVRGIGGEPEPGVRPLSFARAELAALGAGIWPADEADWDRALSVIRGRMDEVTFSSAQQNGEAMALDRALAAVRLVALHFGQSSKPVASDEE